MSKPKVQTLRDLRAEMKAVARGRVSTRFKRFRGSCRRTTGGCSRWFGIASRTRSGSSLSGPAEHNQVSHARSAGSKPPGPAGWTPWRAVGHPASP